MRLVLLGDAIAEHLRRWCMSFSGLGHEVHVITWNSRVLDGYGPCLVHQLKKPASGSGVFARLLNLHRLRTKVRNLIRQIRPDLVHAHDAGAYAWMAMLTGFHPFVITPWGDDILIHIHQRAIDRFFTVRALRRADLLHAEGEDTRDVLLRLGVVSKNMVVMPLGVDIDKFGPGVPPLKFVERHGLAGARIVVSTRTLNPIHDVETTIRAAALVIRKTPATKLLVVGGGVEKQSLQELAKSLGIAGSLVFTGHVEEYEMVACLQAADVYVSTSLSDSGTPASTAEAMACGLPVVSSDVGNIRARIRDGEGGYVVPVKDPDSVADRILHLLEHDEERERAGRTNRRHIEEHYDVRDVVRKMESLYARLCATISVR